MDEESFFFILTGVLIAQDISSEKYSEVHINMNARKPEMTTGWPVDTLKSIRPQVHKPTAEVPFESYRTLEPNIVGIFEHVVLLIERYVLAKRTFVISLFRRRWWTEPVFRFTGIVVGTIYFSTYFSLDGSGWKNTDSFSRVMNCCPSNTVAFVRLVSPTVMNRTGATFLRDHRWNDISLDVFFHRRSR